MATVLRFLSYDVVIYSNDHRPCHVHVMSNEHEAVFDLHCPDGPPALRENYGFRRSVLVVIAAKLGERMSALCTRWSEIHGSY